MTELKLVLEHGECNGYMSVQCYANGQLIAEPQIDKSNNSIVDVKVDFPVELVIKVSGKNNNTDTVVENGQIVKDKYVKLKQVYLARYHVNENMLHTLCQFTPDMGTTEQNNYFYCNGIAKMQFHAQDALRWHLKYNKY